MSERTTFGHFTNTADDIGVVEMPPAKPTTIERFIPAPKSAGSITAWVLAILLLIAGTFFGTKLYYESAVPPQTNSMDLASELSVEVDNYNEVHHIITILRGEYPDEDLLVSLEMMSSEHMYKMHDIVTRSKKVKD